MPNNFINRDNKLSHNPDSFLFHVPEFVLYCDEIGAIISNMKRFVVYGPIKGRYSPEKKVGKVGKDGAIEWPEGLEPDDAKHAIIEKAVKEAIDAGKRPTSVPFESDYRDKHTMLKGAADGDIFEFRNKAKQVVMVQLRVVNDDGESSYLPFSYWSDKRVRCIEPDDEFLPFFNEHRLGEAPVVIVHEGVRGAAKWQRLVDGKTAQDRADREKEPWQREMMGATHIAFIGGALNTQRSDWSKLKNVERVYIYQDNDQAGRDAGSAIIRHLDNIDCQVFKIEFTDLFPVGHDGADLFPETMFGEDGFYTGPSFFDLTRHATWATWVKIIPPPAGSNAQPKRQVKLRDVFLKTAVVITQKGKTLFADESLPWDLKTKTEYNDYWSNRSHTDELADLVLKHENVRRAESVVYRPFKIDFSKPSERIVSNGRKTGFNFFTTSGIRPIKGDISIFNEFMTYFFTEKEERYQMQRWFATLWARPDIRMLWGILLISERQGTGKSTLLNLNKIMVGAHNASIMTIEAVMGRFGEWAAGKRLGCINEVYSGESWKAYHTFKTHVTDETIWLDQKYMTPIELENFIHWMLGSNSFDALKIEKDDRRWFPPIITEDLWLPEKWAEFRRFIKGRGPSALLYWAENEWTDYVEPGEHAPKSLRKEELIEASKTTAQHLVDELFEIVRERIADEGPIALADGHILSWLGKLLPHGEFKPKPRILRSWLKAAGMHISTNRETVGQRKHYLCLTVAKDAAKPDEKLWLGYNKKSDGKTPWMPEDFIEKEM